MALKFDAEFERLAGPILAMMAQAPQPAVHDWQARRAATEVGFGALMAGFPDAPDVVKTEYKLKSHDGVEISVWKKAKQGVDASKPTPAILHAHGGGMIAGTTSTFTKSLDLLVSTTGIPTFDVEYRLAPEQQHTGLVEDCYAALLWLHEHAAEHNVDTSRLCVMGESAGGGIAAGLALMARDRNLSPPLAKQILVYPMLDYKNTRPVPALSKWLVWNEEANLTGWGALLGDRLESGDVSHYASPTYAKDLAGLPSTYIDCGTLDLFRDEDTDYAKRLIEAGVDVELHLWPGVPHAFEVLAPTSSLTQQASAARLRAITTF
ncbi:hypothetical protein LTR64_008154 [Lithohypha guttulata]|uniref:uncharacterized protein n=1 Tax=Lithohypha guttulata TaxID=1690604 RepID=UPI002DE03275|nr:hypothetical protein LTR51_008306 [Lithohypha guttulata]